MDTKYVNRSCTKAKKKKRFDFSTVYSAPSSNRDQEKTWRICTEGKNPQNEGFYQIFYQFYHFYQTQIGFGDVVIKYILWFNFLHFILGWALKKIWRWTSANAVTSATHGAKDPTRTAFWAGGRAFWVNRICKWPISVNNGWNCFTN